MVRFVGTVCLAMVSCCPLAWAGEEGTPSSEKQHPLFCWVEMKRHPEPVLRARPGTWEASWFGVGSANNVNWPDGRMRMYHRGSDRGEYNVQLGVAYSDDGVNWQRDKRNPIWVNDWDYFHMIYTGSNKKNGTGYRWGYAWSTDGIHWTKSPQNPIFLPSPKGAWDAGKVSTHQIYRTGADTYNIYYSGAPTPKATYEGVGLVRARLQKLVSPSKSKR